MLDREYLIRVDNIEEPAKTLKAIAQLSDLIAPRRKMPWVFVTTDPGMGPSYYLDFFKALRVRGIGHPVMQFYDSDTLKEKHPSMRNTKRKFDSFFKGKERILDFVDGVECWNEINLPTNPENSAELAAWIGGAVKGLGLRSFGCWYLTAQEPKSLYDWMDKNPLSCDVALLSHYSNWNGYPESWDMVFGEVARRVPGVQELGIAEYGPEPHEPTAPEVLAQMRNHELLVVNHSLYKGYGGYWDFVRDCARGPHLEILEACWEPVTIVKEA